MQWAPLEDVTRVIGVMTDEVRGARGEADPAPVGAHRAEGARLIALLSDAAEAYPTGRSCDEVTRENVGRVIRVARHEVRSVRGEDDTAAVAADRRRTYA